MDLCLEKNAFSVLQVSTRANRDAILEAHSERMFARTDERLLDAARAKLTVSRDRIVEEISFLPELTPAKSREVLAEILRIQSVPDAVALIESLPNLSRINASANLVQNLPNEPSLITKALEAHEHLDAVSGRRSIEEARASSGFGEVRDNLWSDALSALRDAHASILCEAITRAEGGPLLLASVVGRQRPGKSSWYRSLLDQIVDRYDRWTQPKLAAIEERIDSAIAAVQAAPTDPELLKPIENDLLAWDELRQPIQLRDQANGLDEPKSKRMFEKVRALTLLLANEHKQYRSARELSSVLHECFPELPSALALLENDIDALDRLVDEADVLQPLAEAVGYADENLHGLTLDIGRGHFREDGLGLAGELYDKFEVARINAQNLQNPELPWLMLRSVAIKLNNEASAPHAAEEILRHLVVTAPPSLQPRLEGDLASVIVGALNQDLTNAFETEDWSRAQELLSRLIDADPSDRDRYHELRSKIAMRQVGRNLKRTGWAAAAAVIIIILVGRESITSKEPSIEPTYDEGLDVSNLVVETGEDDSNDYLPVTMEAPDEEIAPPPGFYGPLSRAQLRYCMFEEYRLGVLDREVPRSAYSQFNARVSDFNSRCSGTRYEVSDRDAIAAQLAASDQVLTEEARDILATWEPIVAPPLEPTPLEELPTLDEQIENALGTSL